MCCSFFSCSVPVFATIGRNSMGQRSRPWSKPGEKPGVREGAGEERREREGARARDQGERGAGPWKGTWSRQGQAEGQRAGPGEGRVGLHDGATQLCLHLPFRGPSRVAEDKGRFSVSILLFTCCVPLLPSSSLLPSLRQACLRCVKTTGERRGE